ETEFSSFLAQRCFPKKEHSSSGEENFVTEAQISASDAESPASEAEIRQVMNLTNPSADF
ncbi:MAG: hypothetical protein ABW250_02940, partial [Pyrinomonadaceae bacterium]